MKLQKLLCGLLLVPALVLTGCGKDDDTTPPTTESGSGSGSGSGGETQLQYSAVAQEDVVTLLSTMKEEEKLNKFLVFLENKYKNLEKSKIEEYKNSFENIKYNILLLNTNRPIGLPKNINIKRLIMPSNKE